MDGGYNGYGTVPYSFTKGANIDISGKTSSPIDLSVDQGSVCCGKIVMTHHRTATEVIFLPINCAVICDKQNTHRQEKSVALNHKKVFITLKSRLQPYKLLPTPPFPSLLPSPLLITPSSLPLPPPLSFPFHGPLIPPSLFSSFIITALSPPQPPLLFSG